MREENSTWGKYTFTAADKASTASELSQKIFELKTLEDEKKSAMSSFTAQINVLVAEINRLSENYRNGYEFRHIPCTVELDFDRKVKVYKEAETGYVIREEPLEEEDYQTDILETETESVTESDTEGETETETETGPVGLELEPEPDQVEVAGSGAEAE